MMIKRMLQRSDLLNFAGLSSLFTKSDSNQETSADVELHMIDNEQFRPLASSSTNYSAQDIFRPNNSHNAASFIGQLIQNGGPNGNGSQRSAISPICGEVTLPSLQSPKNAVAPSDIVFNRPPATNSMSTGEFFTGIQSLHVKSNTSPHNEICNGSHSNCELRSTKKNTENLDDTKPKESIAASASERNNKELNFIDEETTFMGPSTSKIPPSLTTCLIDSMVRSCSVGELKSYYFYFITSFLVG